MDGLQWKILLQIYWNYSKLIRIDDFWVPIIHVNLQKCGLSSDVLFDMGILYAVASEKYSNILSDTYSDAYLALYLTCMPKNLTIYLAFHVTCILTLFWRFIWYYIWFFLPGILSDIWSGIVAEIAAKPKLARKAWMCSTSREADPRFIIHNQYFIPHIRMYIYIYICVYVHIISYHIILYYMILYHIS